MPTTNRLTRSRHEKMIAGVCGGLAEHFGWDATLVRVGFVLLSALSAAFPGLIIYILLWIVIPEE